MNDISDTESTASNVRKSERKRHPVEIFVTKMKGQVYMQASKVKKIDKHTKEEQIFIFWYETIESVHLQHGLTDRQEDRIYFHGSITYGNNNRWNQQPRHSK